MFLGSLSEAYGNVRSYASICSETKVLDTYTTSDTTRHLSKQIKMFVSFVSKMCLVFFCPKRTREEVFKLYLLCPHRSLSKVQLLDTRCSYFTI